MARRQTWASNRASSILCLPLPSRKSSGDRTGAGRHFQSLTSFIFPPAQDLLRLCRRKCVVVGKGVDPVSIDSPRPIFFCIEDCINLSKLRRDLHTSYQNALKILVAEGITIYRHWRGQRHSCYVNRIHARQLILKHGSEYARKRRM